MEGLIQLGVAGCFLLGRWPDDNDDLALGWRICIAGGQLMQRAADRFFVQLADFPDRSGLAIAKPVAERRQAFPRAAGRFRRGSAWRGFGPLPKSRPPWPSPWREGIRGTGSGRLAGRPALARRPPRRDPAVWTACPPFVRREPACSRVGYQRRSSIADQGHHLRAEIAEDPPAQLLVAVVMICRHRRFRADVR